jgi:hypothetical protein
MEGKRCCVKGDLFFFTKSVPSILPLTEVTEFSGYWKDLLSYGSIISLPSDKELRISENGVKND